MLSLFLLSTQTPEEHLSLIHLLYVWFLMQDHHFSLLQHETEKLKSDIEKMRSELRSVCIPCELHMIPFF